MASWGWWYSLKGPSDSEEELWGERGEGMGGWVRGIVVFGAGGGFVRFFCCVFADQVFLLLLFYSGSEDTSITTGVEDSSDEARCESVCVFTA